MELLGPSRNFPANISRRVNLIPPSKLGKTLEHEIIYYHTNSKQKNSRVDWTKITYQGKIIKYFRVSIYFWQAAPTRPREFEYWEDRFPSINNLRMKIRKMCQTELFSPWLYPLMIHVYSVNFSRFNWRRSYAKF